MISKERLWQPYNEEEQRALGPVVSQVEVGHCQQVLFRQTGALEDGTTQLFSYTSLLRDGQVPYSSQYICSYASSTQPDIHLGKRQRLGQTSLGCSLFFGHPVDINIWIAKIFYKTASDLHTSCIQPSVCFKSPLDYPKSTMSCFFSLHFRRKKIKDQILKC